MTNGTTITTDEVEAAETWLDRALDAARRADERLVVAALRLLCLRAREEHPEASDVELEWSDQGDFLHVYGLTGSGGGAIEWDDYDGLAWNFEGHSERYWAPFMTNKPDGSRLYLDIAATIAATGPDVAADIVSRVEQVIARSEELDEAWAAATVKEGDPEAKVWQADDDARRELAYDAVEVLREVRAAMTPTKA